MEEIAQGHFLIEQGQEMNLQYCIQIKMNFKK